eukprot:scaffold203531_cov53-Attheya_sp.AAC.2
MCKEQYEWLNKQPFHRLDLLPDGHEQFDGTARGRGKSAETISLVAVEPTEIKIDLQGQKEFDRIISRLWCRNKNVADCWRPYLPENLAMHTRDGHCFYKPISVLCEHNRTVVLLFEQELDPDGTTRQVCVSAIPGVDDPATLKTWDNIRHTVAVSEVMFRLLH